jgi:SOUL heme-binding protein
VLSQVRTVVTQLVESVLSVAGIRVGTEEPSYTSRPLVDGVEIRRYGPRIAAETTIAANEEAARNAGFRRLAGYIFGRNHQDRRIDMTAPVAQQLDQRISQKITMTAPVAQSSAGKQGWIIRFYMPAEWTMESLPTPNDERVRIVTEPAETGGIYLFPWVTPRPRSCAVIGTITALEKSYRGKDGGQTCVVGGGRERQRTVAAKRPRTG